MKVFNALSLNFVPVGHSIYQVPCHWDQKKTDFAVSRPQNVSLQSYIGHADIARIVGLPMNRETCPPLKAGEQFLVAQYVGPRLPEGATSLPEGAKIEYRWLEISHDQACFDMPDHDSMES